MTRECQRSNLVKSDLRPSSSTPSSCLRASLSGIVATPLFLWDTPPSHPICEPSIAIVWSGSGPCGGAPSRRLTRATFSMNSAAPLLLGHTPSSLPIRESVGAIVWICWGWWHCWHWWHWHRWQWHRWQRRRPCGRATLVVDSATPCLFVGCPGIFVIHSAIEWVHWARRHWTSRWLRGWQRWGRRGRWRWWRCGRWRGHWRLWQSRGGSCCGATPAHSAATEILLCLGPCCFPHRESSIAIVRQRGCGS